MQVFQLSLVLKEWKIVELELTPEKKTNFNNSVNSVRELFVQKKIDKELN